MGNERPYADINIKNNSSFPHLVYTLQSVSLQDSLLQSYRNLHLTLQSILLAISTGLLVTILQIDGDLKSMALLGVQAAFSAFGVLVLWEIYGIIRARGEDVSYLHKRLIGAEQGLPPEEKEFMKFKIYQKLGRDDSEYMQRISKTEEVTEEDEIHYLVGEGLGHTRKVIDKWLYFGILTLWALLLSVSIIFVVFPSLH